MADCPIILHVAPISNNKITGLSVSIPATVKALHNLGVQVALLTTSKQGRYENKDGYPIFYFKDKNKRIRITDLPAPFNRPNIIDFHSTYIPAHALLTKEAYRKNIPFIITPRGGMTLGAQNQKKWKKRFGNILFFNRMVKNAAAIHCLTENEANDVRLWKGEIFVLGNGTSLPSKSDMANVGSKETIRLVFIGRLDIHHKGLDLLIHACGIIKGELYRRQVTIDIYGPEVNSSREKLLRLIERHGLSKIVNIYPPVRGSEKSEVLKSADVFLHTSRFEGHPMSVLEALSFGLPCLLTPGTNVSKEVISNRAGWEVMPDESSISKGILNILNEKDNLPNYSKNARELVEKKYVWESIARKTLLHYKDILGKYGVKDEF